MDNVGQKPLKDCTIEEAICHFGLNPVLEWLGEELLENWVNLNKEMGATTNKPKSKLSPEARKAREPLSPAVLINAIQDPIIPQTTPLIRHAADLNNEAVYIAGDWLGHAQTDIGIILGRKGALLKYVILENCSSDDVKGLERGIIASWAAQK